MTGLPATSTSLFTGPQAATQLGLFSVTDVNDQSQISCTIQAPENTLFSVAAVTAPGKCGVFVLCECIVCLFCFVDQQ